jgi:hypothetical protein
MLRVFAGSVQLLEVDDQGTVALRIFARCGRTTVAGGAASRLGRASHRVATQVAPLLLGFAARLRADEHQAH